MGRPAHALNFRSQNFRTSQTALSHSVCVGLLVDTVSIAQRDYIRKLQVEQFIAVAPTFCYWQCMKVLYVAEQVYIARAKFLEIANFLKFTVPK